jgi:hypothetical protein
MKEAKEARIAREQHSGYSGLYLDRSGVNAAFLAEQLISSPERELSQDGSRHRLFRRLDFLRNGIGYAEDGSANMRQRKAEEELFGYRRSYADTYASALRAIESGGSIGDATKTFYKAKRSTMPDTSPQAAAKEAADRVFRLVRGGINSQPMVYAEESIIVNELSKASVAAQQRALAVTGLDLVDQVRLHTFGLLDVPAGGSIDWTTYIRDEVVHYMVPERGEHGEDITADRR